MKTLAMTGLILIGFLAQASFADSTAPQTIVEASQMEVQFDRMYIPAGYDNNDNIQIVGEGMFPNSCYRPGNAKVTVDAAKKIISVTPVAYKYAGLCLQVIVPWHQVLDLGIVSKAGDYKIVQTKGEDKDLGVLNVKQTTRSEPDDYLYAPISQVYFKSNTNGMSTVTLAGDMSSSCMKIKDIKVDVQKDVIVIQPIAEIEDHSNCQKGSFAFDQSVDIKTPAAGEYLLHVRSLNGKAFNNLVTVK